MKKHFALVGFLVLIFWQALSLSEPPHSSDVSELSLRVSTLMKRDNEARVRAIQDQGIDIYAVPVPLAKVHFFQMLPALPTSLSRWAGEFSDGSTAGLYLTPKNSVNRVSKPTILIAEDAEPWALIHEYVHALLDEQRGTQGALHDDEATMVTHLEDAREDLNELWWRYRQLKAFEKEEERLRILQSFLTATSLEREILSIFHMEEILIEGLLRQAFQRERPADFKQETYDFSQHYIQQSARQGVQLLSESLEKCSDLLRLAESLPQWQSRVEKSCQASREMKEKILQMEKAALLR